MGERICSRRIAAAALASLPWWGMAPARASSADFGPRVDALQGLWFGAEGPGAAGERRFVLQVVNVLSAQGGRARLVARWGLADHPWPEAAEALVTEEDGALRLALTPRGGATRVTLRAQPDGSLAGQVAAAGGAAEAVRLARATVGEIHAWIAQNPPPGLRATAASALDLVYLSANDCGPCRGWEQQHLRAGAPRADLGWQALQFTMLKRVSFRNPVPPQDLPEPLRASTARWLEARGWKHFSGTPQWLLYVDQRLRLHGFGTNQFETLVAPGVRAVLAERGRG